jgi:predicted permease
MKLLNFLPWRRARLEQDLGRELTYHVERRIDDLKAAGLAEDAARQRAAIEFGGVAQVQEQVRDAWMWRWLDVLSRDVRYAFRALRRSPGFAGAAILSLALAIGANTAIFSIVQGILLRPLPYPAPDQLVMVWQDMRAKNGPVDEWATPGNFVDWRAQSNVFASVASIRGFAPALVGLGDAEMLTGEQVSRSYFDVLGARPQMGRGFLPEEAMPNAPRVVVVSDRFWRERLGGAGDVLTKQLMLSGESHQIVGVMPADFRPIVNQNADVWRPERLDLVSPSRGAIVLRIVARLQPGVSVADAAEAMSSVAVDLGRRYPETSGNVGVNIVSLHEQVVGNVRPGMQMLTGTVVLVLLIACVNIANLLLARSSARVREMAVRVAVGAARVVRQLLTESVVLASLGGLTGVVLSYWGLKALVAMAPAGTPRLNEVAIDGTVLAVSAGLTILTGLLFGLMPALEVARANHTPALNDGGRGAAAGSSGNRLRKVLVVAEMAIALMLLVGGGLLIRSFAGMQRADLGFEPAGVTSAFVQVPANRFPTPADAIAFNDRMLERISAVPGVKQAAFTSILPLAPGGDNDMNFTIEGVAPPPPSQPGIVAWFRVVSPEYLSLMRMRLRSGRLFEGREAQPSVVISTTLAARHWPGTDPVGRRVRFGPVANPTPWFTIIGVVDDVRQNGARSDPRGQMFIPYWHGGRLAIGGTNLVVRTDTAVDTMGQSLRQAIRELDPTLPVSNVAAMTSLVARTIEEPRFLASIATGFAVLAMLLAAVGVYGVTAYAVTSRQQEIGVRIALGATRSNIFALTYGSGFKLMVVGIVVGIAGAAALAPALRTLLFGLEPIDAVTFAGTGAVLLVTSGLAVLIPALRAANVSPAATLRS